MHIRDFHLKFVSCSEECDLLGALRRLSRLEDPQAMLSDTDGLMTNDWIVWGDAGTGSTLSTATA
jgi:hypothetical protein